MSESSSKSTWRRELKQRLKSQRLESSSSKELCLHLANLLSDHPSKQPIAAFAALPDEPDLFPLLALFPKRNWCLPRIDSGILTMRSLRSIEDLSRGAFGIPEPCEDSLIIPFQEIGIFLCPGLGFTRSGTRLGRGKGFYDRLLADADPNALRIGVAHLCQIVDELPAEPNDISMTHIATSDGVYPVIVT